MRCAYLLLYYQHTMQRMFINVSTANIGLTIHLKGLIKIKRSALIVCESSTATSKKEGFIILISE